MQTVDGSIYRHNLSRTVLQGNSLGVMGSEAPDGGRTDQPGEGAPVPAYPMPKYSDNVEGNDYAGIYRKSSMQRNSLRLMGGPAPSTEAALASYESMSGYASKRGFGIWPFDDPAPDPTPIQTGLDPIVALVDSKDWKPTGGGGGTAKAKPAPAPGPAAPPVKQASMLSNPLLWVGAAVVAGGGFLAFKAHEKKKTMSANRRRRARRNH